MAASPTAALGQISSSVLDVAQETISKSDLFAFIENYIYPGRYVTFGKEVQSGISFEGFEKLIFGTPDEEYSLYDLVSILDPSSGASDIDLGIILNPENNGVLKDNVKEFYEGWSKEMSRIFSVPEGQFVHTDEDIERQIEDCGDFWRKIACRLAEERPEEFSRKSLARTSFADLHKSVIEPTVKSALKRSLDGVLSRRGESDLYDLAELDETSLDRLKDAFPDKAAQIDDALKEYSKLNSEDINDANEAPRSFPPGHFRYDPTNTISQYAFTSPVIEI